MKLLFVQSSANPGVSWSKKWAERVVHRYQALHENLVVHTLDLEKTPVPHLSSDKIAAMYTPIEARSAAQTAELELSDALIEQFLAADIVVLGVPMYNFSVPSALKAYVDHIVRVGRTFKYTPTGPQGLVLNPKAMIIVSSSGGIYTEGPNQAADFVAPYLQTIFGFLGLSDIKTIRLEGSALGQGAIEASEVRAAAIIQALS